MKPKSTVDKIWIYWSLGDSNFNPGIKSALVQAKLPKGLRQLPLGEGTVVPLGVVLHE